MLVREYFLPQIEAARKVGQSDPSLFYMLDSSTQAGFAAGEGVRVDILKTNESALEQLSDMTFERVSGNLPVFIDNRMVEHELL